MAENAQLELLKALHLRSICKDLNIRTSGCKLELLSRLRAFLDSDEGKLKAYLRLNKTNLTVLFNDPDPFLTLGLIYHPLAAPTSMLEPPTPVQEMESRFKNEIRCICISGTLPGLPCTVCHRIQHIRCMAENAKMKPYVCPLCQLMKVDLCSMPHLPPIVNPFAVSRSNPNITRRNMDRLIRISEAMMAEILANPGTVRVEVRCLRLDGKGFANTWPVHVRVKVNNEEVLCMPDNVYFKTQKGPLDVTDRLHVGDNVMHFFRYEDPEYFCVAVFLVRCTSTSQIVDQIVAESHKLSFAEGLDLVLRNISNDEELKQDSTPICVKCPISMRYIKVAVRGKECTHVQCYDLETFIIIFGKNAQCPECGKMVTAFVVDDFITQMAKLAEEKNTFTVYIHRDGSYTFLTEDETREEYDASDVEDGEVAFVRTVQKKEEAIIEPDAIDLDEQVTQITMIELDHSARKREVRRIDLEGGVVELLD